LVEKLYSALERANINKARHSLHDVLHPRTDTPTIDHLVMKKFVTAPPSYRGVHIQFVGSRERCKQREYGSFLTELEAQNR